MRLSFPPTREQTVRIGRPSHLDSNGKIGIILIYLNSRMTLAEISLLFGVVPSVASDTISSMLSVVHDSLKKNPSARIKFPSYLELVSYANMVSQRTPQVQNVVGFIDGVKFPIQCSSDIFEQSTYYNGHTKDTVVNNVVFFAPTS